MKSCVALFLFLIAAAPSLSQRSVVFLILFINNNIIVFSATAPGLIRVCTTEKTFCLAQIMLEVVLLHQEPSKYIANHVPHFEQSSIHCYPVYTIVACIEHWIINYQHCSQGRRNRGAGGATAPPKWKATIL